MPTYSHFQRLAEHALAEDCGSGDATTLALVPKNAETNAQIVTREPTVCAGLPLVEAVFRVLDTSITFQPMVAEGDRCGAGWVLAEISGKAQAVLTGERTALNYLQRLCGIATLTRQYVDAVGNHATQILDTRKTTPGLRMIEKYAVFQGGGTNHRFGLYDRIMIKDNHRRLAELDTSNSLNDAVQKCREQYPGLEIEIEADTVQQALAAAESGADYVLLDNMSDAEIAGIVDEVGDRCTLEASGGITLERIPSLAATGVHSISVGALTHSPGAVDIGLDIDQR